MSDLQVFLICCAVAFSVMVICIAITSVATAVVAAKDRAHMRITDAIERSKDTEDKS